MKKSLITLVVFFGLALLWGALAVRVSLAQGGEMQVANALYANGRYAEAAQSYEQLLAQGVADSALYYNLGSAYLNQGDVGRAILNYRRAAELDPRDAETQAALVAARALALDQFPAENGSLLDDVANLSRGFVTLNELAMLALGFWFVFGLLWFVYRQSGNGRSRPIIQTGAIMAGLLLALVLLAMGSRVVADNGRSPAVIVAQTASVSDQPAASAAFVLHSGAEVELTDRQGEWVRIALPGGQVGGWVLETAVAPVQ
jgi:tetratricopeptide (TPR) repeat protein